MTEPNPNPTPTLDDLLDSLKYFRVDVSMAAGQLKTRLALVSPVPRYGDDQIAHALRYAEIACRHAALASEEIARFKQCPSSQPSPSTTDPQSTQQSSSGTGQEPSKP